MSLQIHDNAFLMCSHFGFSGDMGSHSSPYLYGSCQTSFLVKTQKSPRGCSYMVYTTDGERRWRDGWLGGMREGRFLLACWTGAIGKTWQKWGDICGWRKDEKVWMRFKQRQRDRLALMTKLWSEKKSRVLSLTSWSLLVVLHVTVLCSQH